MARPPHEEAEDLFDLLAKEVGGGEAPPGRRKSGTLRLLFTLALVLAAGGATVATAWHLLYGSQQAPAGGAVPVVKAPAGPVKTRPADPGGLKVPDQDKLVYDRFAGAPSSTPPVERLLPPPEEPEPPPAPADTASPPPTLATPRPAVERLTAAAPDATIAPPAEPAAPAPEPASRPAEPEVKPAAPAVAAAEPEPIPAEKDLPPLPVIAAAPPPAPAPVPAPVPAAAVAGEFQVQLAALRAPEAAEQEWKRLQRVNEDLLGPLSPDIVRADLGAKGVFYRLRAGPLDEESARSLCRELGARKVGCMVVRK